MRRPVITGNRPPLRVTLHHGQGVSVLLPGRIETQTGEENMVFILGVIYVVLLITLGVISLRKGHWVMFIIGLFIPLFWIIGAVIPRRVR